VGRVVVIGVCKAVFFRRGGGGWTECRYAKKVCAGVHGAMLLVRDR
jgi:hypothetical protein